MNITLLWLIFLIFFKNFLNKTDGQTLNTDTDTHNCMYLKWDGGSIWVAPKTEPAYGLAKLYRYLAINRYVA